MQRKNRLVKNETPDLIKTDRDILGVSLNPAALS